MLDHSSPAPDAPSPPAIHPATAPVILLSPRHEAFCKAMACGVGAAEAARRAGYSPYGAKQRGAVLTARPEIRVRIDQLRTDRQACHQDALDRAAALVETIGTEALERKSLGLALRAVELGLKLRGVVQDKRIPHHYLGDRPHPDADLEIMYCDPEEEADHATVGGAPEPGPDQSPGTRQAPPPAEAAAAPEPAPAAKPAATTAAVPAAMPDSDLSTVSIVTRPARPAPALLGSTSLSEPSAPVPPFRVPAAA
ncbi:hypothetical protein JL101_020770 [Skermanella rosea]|uniref:hypothetical protein n=1 Tax=Skermanella rosea TaxID=1817965 RepID=UPI0019348DAE|nr:hypothetical protein [Skermanella rosea]UEM02407.1 hypothetical protein JL101_020770 [Skermanella rosea]